MSKQHLAGKQGPVRSPLAWSSLMDPSCADSGNATWSLNVGNLSLPAPGIVAEAAEHQLTQVNSEFFLKGVLLNIIYPGQILAELDQCGRLSF